MEPLEQTLFRFWSSCLLCLRRSACLSGDPRSTRSFLRGYYQALRDILGNPEGAPVDFPHYPDALEDDMPDGALLAQEHWIATRVFKNKLVAVWGPSEPAPAEFANCPPDRMWLDSQPGSVWGRIYKRPLRPEKPLERMALESTKRALDQQQSATFAEPLQLPEQSWGLLTDTNYRAFSREELKTLIGDWPALASAADRGDNQNFLRTAAESSDDPRVWTWYALKLATGLAYGVLDSDWENRERWLALEKLRRLDPDNGSADLLEAFLYVKVGLASKSAGLLARAVRRKSLTFYSRERWDLLWRTSQKLRWTPEQSRQLVLGSSCPLLLPLSAFGKELVHTKARASLKKLALQEINQPMIAQQMVGCVLLVELEPQNRAVARLRKRSKQNLEFIQALRPEQLTEQRWDSYFWEVINSSENEAIERLREEGYLPLGSAESWLDKLLSSKPGHLGSP
jgi:hypothetical protein